jgi:hypothetical protein
MNLFFSVANMKTRLQYLVLFPELPPSVPSLIMALISSSVTLPSGLFAIHLLC